MSFVHRIARFFNLNPYPQPNLTSIHFKTSTTSVSVLSKKALLEKIFNLLDFKALSKIRLVTKSDLTQEANKQIGLRMLGTRLKEFRSSYHYVAKDGSLITHSSPDSELKICVDLGVVVKKLNLISKRYLEEESIALLIQSCPNLEHLALKSYILANNVITNLLNLKNLNTLEIELTHYTFEAECKKNILISDLISLSKIKTLKIRAQAYNWIHLAIKIPSKILVLEFPPSLKKFKTEQIIDFKTLSKYNQLSTLDIYLSEENIDSTVSLSGKALENITLRNVSVCESQKILKQFFSHSFPCLHTLTIVGFFDINEDFISRIPPSVEYLRLIDCSIHDYRIFSHLPKNILKLYIFSPYPYLLSSVESDVCKDLVLPDHVKYITIHNKDVLSSLRGNGLVEIEVDKPIAKVDPKYLEDKSYLVKNII